MDSPISRGARSREPRMKIGQIILTINMHYFEDVITEK